MKIGLASPNSSYGVPTAEVAVDLEPLLKQAKEKAKGALGDELKKRIGGLFKKPGG